MVCMSICVRFGGDLFIVSLTPERPLHVYGPGTATQECRLHRGSFQEDLQHLAEHRLVHHDNRP